MFARILSVGFSNALQRPLNNNRHVILARRNFSCTPRTLAAEDPDSILSNIRNTPLFKQLADKPDALRALQDFARLLQESGVDITGGQPPSPAQMFRLMAKKEIKDGAINLITELKKAGMEMPSQAAIAELWKPRSQGREGGDSDS